MKPLSVVIACAVALGLAGCTATTPFVAGSPAVSLTSTACPSGPGAAQDVSAPGLARTRLLDPASKPTSGVVCEYGSVFDQGAGARHTLTEQIVLSTASATELATAAARIELATPAPPAGCPADDGRVTVITFDYLHHPAAHLWWHTAGCQSIDDGQVQAQQVANESFSRFQTVFAHSIGDQVAVIDTDTETLRRVGHVPVRPHEDPGGRWDDR